VACRATIGTRGSPFPGRAVGRLASLRGIDNTPSPNAVDNGATTAVRRGEDRPTGEEDINHAAIVVYRCVRRGR